MIINARFPKCEVTILEFEFIDKLIPNLKTGKIGPCHIISLYFV